MISRDDIAAAETRIRAHIRRTPCLELQDGAFGFSGPLNLKLEFLQHAGSFKPRGAFNTLLSSTVPPPASLPRRAAITVSPSPMRRVARACGAHFRSRHIQSCQDRGDPGARRRPRRRRRAATSTRWTPARPISRGAALYPCMPMMRGRRWPARAPSGWNGRSRRRPSTPSSSPSAAAVSSRASRPGSRAG